MKKVIRFISILLCIIFVFSFYGCEKEEDLDFNEIYRPSTVPDFKDQSVTLPFFKDAGINPITSINRYNFEALQLVFDGLIRLDKDFSPINILASEINAVNLSTFRVKLKQDILFHNGENLTAQDVEYSYKTVKANPGSPYYDRTENISQTKIIDSYTIDFILKTPDINFVNCLDVPIIRNNSASSSKPFQPNGTGRFKLIEKSEGGYTLSANRDYKAGLTPTIGEFKLFTPPDMETMILSFNAGLFDALPSDFLGYQSTTIKRQISTYNYATNNLFYIGINCNKEPLNSAEFRNVLNYAINKEELKNSIVQDRGTAAPFPFLPIWAGAKEIKIPQKDLSEALNKFNISSTKPVNFNLLVNQDNAQKLSTAEKISELYKQYGIILNVEKVDAATFLSRLQAGTFDLYLGEVKIPQNMDISFLISPDSQLNYGKYSGNDVLTSINQYRAGEIDIAALTAVFDAATPFISLFYKFNQLYLKKNIGGNIVPSNESLYFGSELWKFEK